jgi:hypothetical protein
MVFMEIGDRLLIDRLKPASGNDWMRFSAQPYAQKRS